MPRSILHNLKKAIPALLVWGCFFFSKAAEEVAYQPGYVLLKGYAKGAEGRMLRWTVEKDPISKAEEVLGECLIDSNAYFFLQTRIPETKASTLRIDYYSTTLYIQPENVYEIEFSAYDYHLDRRMNAFIASNWLQPLSFDFVHPDSNELNQLLWSYNRLYLDRMEEKNGFEQALVYGDPSEVKLLIEDCKKRFDFTFHAYFKQYVRYHLATLESFTQIKSNQRIIEQYLRNIELSYNNTAQMEFIFSYYDDFFGLQRKIPLKTLHRNILLENLNEEKAIRHLPSLLDTLGADPSLVNEQLREFVLIYALHQAQIRQIFDLSTVQIWLQAIRETTKFNAHREIIQNLSEKYRDHYDQFWFRNLNLRNETSEICIDDLLEKNKFHYFFFVRNSYEICPNCREEIEYLKKIYLPEYYQSLQVYIIDCDYDWEEYLHLKKKTGFENCFHFNKNIAWLRKIGATNFPMGILVDDQGRVLNTSLGLPSKKLAELFKKINTAYQDFLKKSQN